ncbi:hypothetical protein [Treponema sp. R8-4-B8]
METTEEFNHGVHGVTRSFGTKIIFFLRETPCPPWFLLLISLKQGIAGKVTDFIDRHYLTRELLNSA